MNVLLPNGYIRVAVPISDPGHPQLRGTGGFIDVAPTDPDYERGFMFLRADDLRKAKALLAKARRNRNKAAAAH